MNAQDISDIAEVIQNRFEEAKNRYGLIWERPVFNFQLKGTTAGRANLRANLIKVNWELYRRNKSDFLKQTLPHEVAHLAAFRQFSDRGHGNGWKRVMVDFGLQPTRCHSYDVSEVKSNTKKFYYTCGCSRLEISTTIHNRITQRLKMGQGAGYSCKKCRQPIKFTGIQKTA